VGEVIVAGWLGSLEPQERSIKNATMGFSLFLFTRKNLEGIAFVIIVLHKGAKRRLSPVNCVMLVGLEVGVKWWVYGVAVVFPLGGFWLLHAGGAWLWLEPAVSFGLIPLLDMVWVGGSEEGGQEPHGRGHDGVIYLLASLYLGVLVWALHLVATGHYSPWEMVGAWVTTGIFCGTFGINIAHELGHRTQRFPRAFSKMLLLSTLYMHFFIEHNRGHHAQVATHDDPATSRRGESVYAFYPRTILGGWRSAWALEKRHLRGKPCTFRNQMLRFQLCQVGLLSCLWLWGGWSLVVFFLGCSLLGILLLETINYVEHYGLTREIRANGRPERVAPIHSWNSNHPVGRALLFELTRHADHHAQPGRPYGALRHMEAAPQLPTGYSGMVLLSLLPPLWFKVMDHHLEVEWKRLAA